MVQLYDLLVSLQSLVTSTNPIKYVGLGPPGFSIFRIPLCAQVENLQGLLNGIERFLLSSQADQGITFGLPCSGILRVLLQIIVNEIQSLLIGL